MPISRDAVIWGYRFLLGRDPESEEVIVATMQLASHLILSQKLVNSVEFASKGYMDVLLGKKQLTSSPNIGAHAPLLAGSNGQFTTIKISDLSKTSFLSEKARLIKGEITFPSAETSKLRNVKIGFHCQHTPAELSGVEINLKSIPDDLAVHISHSDQKVSFGVGCTGRWKFLLWGAMNVSIGNGVTSNGVECFVGPGGELLIGDDCMFATAFIHVGDNHAVLDIKTGETLNYSTAPRIAIGKHVWIASLDCISCNYSSRYENRRGECPWCGGNRTRRFR